MSEEKYTRMVGASCKQESIDDRETILRARHARKERKGRGGERSCGIGDHSNYAYGRPDSLHTGGDDDFKQVEQEELSTSILSPMKWVVFFRATYLCDPNNNKENIPPFSANQTDPFLANVPPTKKTFKRRVRQPLADITHLFKNSAQSGLAEENGSTATLASSVSVCVSNSRKRKAFEEAEEFCGPRSPRIGFR
ncbi:unnamed protein product [Dovyalis caffra]|uniref:Breast cancer susceptibility 1 n=1 Tax=Dovyalis caffra TaxID=77055 RepID=A0AAV1QRM7_9ROSI|nr:unnamed protein product [Dovyalis caffra]